MYTQDKGIPEVPHPWIFTSNKLISPQIGSHVSCHVLYKNGDCPSKATAKMFLISA